MKDRYARRPRWILSIAIAAALLTPAPAISGGDRANEPGPTARNDAAHFGGSAPSGRSNPSQLNDRAHFGEQAVPAQGHGPKPVVVRVGAGFDWAAAGVGAAGMLGLTLVAVVGASALRRRNRLGAASA